MLYPVGWLLSGWKSELGYSAYWDTLPIHVRRHLFGLCCLGLQQSTNSVKQNSHPYEGFFCPFLWQWFSLCLFHRIEASQAVLWNHYLFLLWTKHGFLAPWPDFANWPVAMLMSLMHSWNGLIIFSSSTDRSLCNVSHFFNAVLDTPCHGSHFESFSSDIAVITGRAFTYLATAALFFVMPENSFVLASLLNVCSRAMSVQTPLNFPSFLRTHCKCHFFKLCT